MKKYSLLSLLICFLFACSDDKTDMPKLELSGVFLNGEDKDYSYNLKDVFPLSAGDFIDVSFRLYGNGADLKSFMLKNENSNIKSLMSFNLDEISDDFTELDKGIIGYKDGIKNTEITVKLAVRSPQEEESRISFYLNSKAPDCEGAVYYLDLTTTTKPRVSEKE